jgi:aspartate aminotransferase
MNNGEINKTVAAISDSVTLAITSQAKAMAAAGKEVFSFGAGEPDFDTPEHIKAAAAKALMDGQTKYAPSAGILPLQKAISAKLATENGLNYAPEQVIVSCGAKHSLYNAILSLCNQGDEVIVPSPYWLSYPEMIRLALARPVFVDCRESNDFKMTAEEFEGAITGRTKAVILNSPSNPVGVVYTRKEIASIVNVAVRRGIYIIADEIYEKLVYEGVEHVSPGSLSKDALAWTITVNGFSKAYSMTGWRVGYFAGPLPLVKAACALQSHSVSSPATFCQYGALAALQGSDEFVRKMAPAFEQRRDYLYKRLLAVPGITCVKPMGAFYALPSIAGLGMKSGEFSQRLLETEGVAVVPGAPFGVDDHVRLSYACSMETIRQGMDHFERFVKSIA